ncbi:MAG: hypothetical protein ACR2P4_09180 [Gammaproteobacteria bacterium]
MDRGIRRLYAKKKSKTRRKFYHSAPRHRITPPASWRHWRRIPFVIAAQAGIS